MLGPKSGTKKMRKIEENAPLLTLFFTLEKTFERIALRPAREPALKARDNLKITKNPESGFSKGRQKDGKRTAKGRLGIAKMEHFKARKTHHFKRRKWRFLHRQISQNVTISSPKWCFHAYDQTVFVKKGRRAEGEPDCSYTHFDPPRTVARRSSRLFRYTPISTFDLFDSSSKDLHIFALMSSPGNGGPPPGGGAALLLYWANVETSEPSLVRTDLA